MNEPTHVDLFSGIGGFALAAQWAGFRTVAFCEIDKYCQRILAKNFLADTQLHRCSQREESSQGQQHGAGRNSWSEPESSGRIPIHANIFDFDGTKYRGCDLITGGFPCQPFSVAGKRRGAADDRAIWPQMFRVISEARPAFVLGENVPGIIPMELDNVLSDLEGIGYACRSFVIPACAVDARHRRDRLWIVCRKLSDANEPRSQGRNGSVLRECASECVTRPSDPSIPNANCTRQPSSGNNSGMGRQGESVSGRSSRDDYCHWFPEPDVGRVAHGIPSRVDRLKGLGNAIVPQVAYEILREIRKLL